MAEQLHPEPQARRFSLDERADTPDKQQKLKSLREHVQLLEAKLFAAYPTPIREGKAQDVAERVTQDLLEIAAMLENSANIIADIESEALF